MIEEPRMDRALLDAVAEVVDEACALVLELLVKPRVDWQKGDKSPVTDIDLAVDRLLAQRLRPLLPSAAWLSEETADDPARLGARTLWVVDPIDGTRGLLAGTAEFCISVGLVHDREVRLALVANPKTGERTFALRGRGAWNERGERLRVCERLGTPLRVAASHSEVRRGMWRDLPDALGDQIEVLPSNSLALKMVLVARGEVDGTVTPWPRSEWDAAAGDLIVAEAGGHSLQVGGAPLDYNRERPLFDGVLCSSGPALQPLLALGRVLTARRALAVAARRANRGVDG